MEGAGRAALIAAATQLGINAWRTGVNVKEVLEAAGYAQSIVQGVVSYISRSSSEALEAYSISSKRSYQSQEPTTTTTEPMTPNPKRGRYTVPTAPVAPKVKKYVKRCMNQMLETKRMIRSLSITNITGAGTIIPFELWDITQGTTDASRTGNQIKIQRLFCRLTFSNDAVCKIRVVVAWDRQPNGANAAILDILNTADTSSVYNPNTVVGHGGNRIKVIYDKTFFLELNVTATNDQRQFIWNWYGKKYGLPKTITFGANDGLVTDMASNNLVGYCLANVDTADLVASAEIVYTDG